MAERIESVREVFEVMPERFLPDKAGDLNAVIQMNLTGDEGGQWLLIVKDQTLTVNEGTQDNPDMTLTAAASDWLDVINGDTNAMALFMQGKIKVQGDMQLALKMQSMFATN